MKLLNIFKPKPKKQLFQGHRFDYHEDNFCRVEMRPWENLDELREDLTEIRNIQENHSLGGGFTKVHIIKDARVKTLSRKIKIEELEELIKKTGFKKYDCITTGYGSQVYDSNFSIGYGNEYCALLFERNQEMVDHIWFNYYPQRDNNPVLDPIVDYITEISNRWDLILVDWNLEVLVDSKNKGSLLNYLKGDFEK